MTTSVIINKSTGSALHVYNSYRHVTPKQPLIKDFLSQGFSILGGGAKEGKSIMTTQMVLAIAQGASFLNHFETRKCDILYISLEEDFDLMGEKLVRICTDDLPSGQIFFEFEWPPISEGGLDIISDFLDKNKNIGLVVIDTLSSLYNGKSRLGKNYMDEYAEARQLGAIIKDRDVSLLLIHHTIKNISNNNKGKPTSLYGSSGYAGVADNILILDSDKECNVGKLTLSSRYGDAAYALKFDKIKKCWNFLGDLQECDLTRERSDVLECLVEACGPANVKDIAKELGKKLPAISNILAKLYKQGLVIKPTFRTYEITDAGKIALVNQLIV